MSIIDLIIGSIKRKEESREKILEKRIEVLEKNLFETAKNLKMVADLSLRMGRELEAISNYIKLNNKQRPLTKTQDDDFYN